MQYPKMYKKKSLYIKLSSLGDKTDTTFSGERSSLILASKDQFLLNFYVSQIIEKFVFVRY